MRVVPLLLVAFATIAASPNPRPALKHCDARLQHADRDSMPARARKLSEMPPANQIKTVYREMDGCPKPMIVRRDIGAK